jgi:hypothetical protein
MSNPVNFAPFNFLDIPPSLLGLLSWSWILFFAVALAGNPRRGDEALGTDGQSRVVALAPCTAVATSPSCLASQEARSAGGAREAQGFFGGTHAQLKHNSVGGDVRVVACAPFPVRPAVPRKNQSLQCHQLDAAALTGHLPAAVAAARRFPAGVIAGRALGVAARPATARAFAGKQEPRADRG